MKNLNRQRGQTTVQLALILVAVVVVVFVLFALLKGAADAERKRQIEAAPGRVAALETNCGLAESQYYSNEETAIVQWATARQAGFASGHDLQRVELNFPPDFLAGIRSICGKVPDLKARLAKSSDMSKDDKEKELLKLYDEAATETLDSLIKAPMNVSLGNATAALNKVIEAMNEAGNARKAVDNANNARNLTQARSDLDSGDSLVTSAWQTLSSGRFAKSLIVSVVDGGYWSQNGQDGAYDLAVRALNEFESARTNAKPKPTATPVPPTDKPMPTKDTSGPSVRPTSSGGGGGPVARPTSSGGGGGPVARPTSSSSKNSGPVSRPKK